MATLRSIQSMIMTVPVVEATATPFTRAMDPPETDGRPSRIGESFFPPLPLCHFYE